MKKFMPLWIACVIFAGCQDKQSSDEDAKKISDRLEILEKKQEEDGKRLQHMRELIATLNRPALLPVSSTGYFVFDTNVGPMVASIKSIKAFGPGSAVDILIGNTTSATINGLSFKVTWFMENYFENTPKQITAPETFRPGTWTEVTIHLDKTPPDKVAFVEISEAKINAISLR